MHDKKTLSSFFYNNEVRAFLFQVIAFLVVIFLIYNAVDNMFINMESRGIRTGFGFLGIESGFEINEALIEYSPASSNLRVFFVGLLNTIVVSIIGIFFATILGLIIGVARLSNNYLIAKLSAAYIELFRNIPILLQIFFWYNVALNVFPHPRQSFVFFDSIFINLRGVFMPQPIAESGLIWVFIAFLLAIVLTVFMRRYFAKKQDETGVQTNTFVYSLLLLFGLPLLVFLLLGRPMTLEYPELKGFNFRGGMTLSPEFLALAFSLSVYTATYIAEAVRSGIESVSKGQKEAALSMGLSSGQTLKLVLLPQALRVAIPPTINQYLNLAKNSSLATAIGYPEIVNVFAGTVLNQVGQAVEIILMTMAVYLTLSLTISFALNMYNRKMAIKER